MPSHFIMSVSSGSTIKTPPYKHKPRVTARSIDMKWQKADGDKGTDTFQLDRGLQAFMINGHSDLHGDGLFYDDLSRLLTPASTFDFENAERYWPEGAGLEDSVEFSLVTDKGARYLLEPGSVFYTNATMQVKCELLGEKLSLADDGDNNAPPTTDNGSEVTPTSQADSVVTSSERNDGNI